MRFYLGTHRPDWLGKVDVPLFVSHNQIADRCRARLPRARAAWALDSGGFTELEKHGRWRTGPDEWVEHVARYAEEIGRLEWAAPQDWMVEPWILAKTGLSVREHQERTVANFLELRGRVTGYTTCLACGGNGVDPLFLPAGVAEPCTVCTSEGMVQRSLFIPVLQGWTLEDYHACVDLYADAGVDLELEPIVGVGSVCRRQNTDEIERIMRSLAGRGLRLHGFGVKKDGLARYGRHLASADSMAWSFQGRRMKLRGCTHRARSCQNCVAWALVWRGRVLDALERGTPTEQLDLAL